MHQWRRIVARSKLFVRERTAKALVLLDTPEIEANIEHTRFPVPRMSNTSTTISRALNVQRI